MKHSTTHRALIETRLESLVKLDLSQVRLEREGEDVWFKRPQGSYCGSSGKAKMCGSSIK